MNRFAVASFLSLAAVAVAFSLGTNDGSGHVETQRRSVRAFKALDISGIGAVRVRQGSEFSVTVTMDANLQPLYETVIRGDTLKLGFKEGSRVSRVTKLDVDIVMPELTSVDCSGACSLDAAGFSGKRFDLNASGASKIVLAFDYETLALEMSGAGSLSVTGTSTEVAVELSGVTTMAARDLRCKRADVEISGSGTVELRVEESLSVEISGTGTLMYYGNPRVTQEVSGKGSVKKVGD